MDAIRTDNQVIVAGRAVGEADQRRLAVLEVGHRQTEPDVHGSSRIEQGLVQRRAMDRHAAADTGPQPVDVDVGEQAAAVVKEALPPDRVRTFG